MSRDDYNPVPVVNSGARSPGRSNRRLTELPTVDRSPSRDYGSRGSPLAMGSPYYRDMDEPTSPAGGGHHRSRSASRPPMSHAMDYPRTRYQSLDRGGLVDPHDREFIPIREPRDRSRDRSLERGLYLEDELYGRSARQSPNPMAMPSTDRAYLGDLQHQNSDLQRELGQLKRELELTNQKLGSSMHSIKTFWSPELKKERALRKEESAKYSLINDQLKLLSSENQKQAMLVRQLEEELRMRMRQPNIELQQQMEAVYAENEHLQREIGILRETIKDLEVRSDAQKQTVMARDESIKKLLEMLQNKGMGKEEERQMFQQMQAMAQKQMYNYSMGSPPLPDILGQYYGPSDIYGASSSSYPYDTLTSGLSTIGGTGFGYRTSQSPLPTRRRYSIGGLPTATMSDIYNIQQQQQQNQSATNLNNLLNETSKSISRSTQILNQRLTGGGLGSTTSTGFAGIGGIGGMSSYPQLYFGEQPTHSSNLLNDNLMQMSTNFSSQPNIYIHPYSNVGQQTTTTAGGGSGPTISQNYYRLKPTLSSSQLNYLYTKPQYYNNLYSQNPYLTSNLLTQQQQQQQQNIYQQRNIMPTFHSSNPALSHTATSNLHYHQLYNPISQQQPQQQYIHHPYHSLQQQLQSQLLSSHQHPYHQHQQQNLHQQQPFSSGYTNQHFDHHLHQQQHHTHHPYQVPLSKLDLDYTKPPEPKRQVSFKFDVDTLSIDS